MQNVDINFLHIPIAPTSKVGKEQPPVIDIRHPAEAFFSHEWVKDTQWLGYRQHTVHPQPGDPIHLALSRTTLMTIARDEARVLNGLRRLMSIVKEEGVLGVAPLPGPEEMYYPEHDVTVYPVRFHETVEALRLPMIRSEYIQIKTVPPDARNALFRTDIDGPAYVNLRHAFQCFAALKYQHERGALDTTLRELCEAFYFQGLWPGLDRRSGKWILSVGTYGTPLFGHNTEVTTQGYVSEDRLFL